MFPVKSRYPIAPPYTPRLSFSSSSMIWHALNFGAPDSVPAGSIASTMFYFSSDDIELSGASPETLAKLENGKISTFPLAGTRPRGKDDEEDKALEAELLKDEKELAEHNMLVDLGRNDIGKVSEIGSVKVEEYLSIERFSHVMHIGSTVTGKIRADKDAVDAVDAILPAGTLSGAPKFRLTSFFSH